MRSLSAIIIFFLGIYALFKSKKMHWWQLKVWFSSWVIGGPLIAVEAFFRAKIPTIRITEILSKTLLIYILLQIIWIWVLLWDAYQKKQFPVTQQKEVKVLLLVYPFVIVLAGGFIGYVLLEK